MDPVTIALIPVAAAGGAWLWHRLTSFRGKIARLQRKRRWHEALQLIEKKQDWDFLRFFIRHRMPLPSRAVQDELLATFEELNRLKVTPLRHLPETLRASVAEDAAEAMHSLWLSAADLVRLQEAGVPEHSEAVTAARAQWSKLRESAREARALAENQPKHTASIPELALEPMNRILWQIREMSRVDHGLPAPAEDPLFPSTSAPAQLPPSRSTESE